MQCTAFVGRRVDDLLLGDQLGQLVALGVTPDAAGLIGEVDLKAVPGELPHHGDRHHRGAVRPRSHAHAGRAQRAGDAADGARVVRGVEDVQRALHLELGVGGHGADVALRAARRLHRQGLRGRRGLVLGLVVVGGLARALAPAGPQAVDQRAALVTRVAHLEVVGAGLADPALVLRARRAQVADAAALAAREVVLGVLAAQQGAPADVAGDVQLVRAYVPRARHDRRGEVSNAPLAPRQASGHAP